MRSINILKAGAVMFALVLSFIFTPQVNAQRVGAPAIAVQFDTNPFGGLLGQEQINGTFGNIFGGGKWIGMGQPFGLPVYGLRIQEFSNVATFSINTLANGDQGTELQWGGDQKQMNINWIFDPFAGNAGKGLAMCFIADELIGVRNQKPDRTFTIRHQNSTSGGGLSLWNESNNVRWGIVTAPTQDMELYRNGAFRGRFDRNTGIYFPFSDARMKEDVQDLQPVIDDIMKLRPTTYLIKGQEDDKRNYGLIAQELKEVFPEMVDVRKKGENDDNLEDLHTVGYTLLIPVLIKGIQEQQDQIAVQQAEIDALKAQLETQARDKGAASFFEDAAETNVLFQNSPNPFNNFTTIEYQLNSGFNKAAIYVYDLNGRQVLSYDNLAAGEGAITIPGNELDPGMFLYSLIVDGKEVATKRMILTK